MNLEAALKRQEAYLRTNSRTAVWCAFQGVCAGI